MEEYILNTYLRQIGLALSSDYYMSYGLVYCFE